MTGNRILTAKFEKQPRLENLAKFLAAGFERRPARAHALKTRNFSEVGAVFQKFVPSGSKLFQNILRQHRTEEYHKNPVLGDPLVLDNSRDRMGRNPATRSSFQESNDDRFPPFRRVARSPRRARRAPEPHGS